MPFDILHFREAERILQEKSMLPDVQATLDYLDTVLYGSLYRRELFREALAEMGWRENGGLNFISGRRYQYKGFKNGVALEGSFGAYEFILEGLLRLQVGYDQGLIETGILLLNAQRSDKTPYGSTEKMVKEEIDLLYPTISLPVTIVLFDLGIPLVEAEPAAHLSDSGGAP